MSKAADSRSHHPLRTIDASSRQNGQALAEFAIAIPLVLLLLCNLMDFGRAMLCYNFVCDAARDATRYAATHGADSSSPTTSNAVSAYVASELPQGLSSSDLTVTTTWSPNDNAGSTVHVTVQYNYQPMTPMFVVKALSLASGAQMTMS
jgi:Flp pilus assembly protein TadG